MHNSLNLKDVLHQRLDDALTAIRDGILVPIHISLAERQICNTKVVQCDSVSDRCSMSSVKCCRYPDERHHANVTIRHVLQISTARSPPNQTHTDIRCKWRTYLRMFLDLIYNGLYCFRVFVSNTSPSAYRHCYHRVRMLLIRWSVSTGMSCCQSWHGGQHAPVRGQYAPESRSQHVPVYQARSNRSLSSSCKPTTARSPSSSSTKRRSNTTRPAFSA